MLLDAQKRKISLPHLLALSPQAFGTTVKFSVSSLSVAWHQADANIITIGTIVDTWDADPKMTSQL